MADEIMSDADLLQSVSGFSFSGKPVDNNLESSIYTLANVLVDISGSVGGYKNELEQAIKSAVGACQKAPTAEAMMARVSFFASNLHEFHGFKPVKDIDLSSYDGCVNTYGSTALWDASLEALETVKAYGEKLVANDYQCNGIVFVITDGGENASKVADPAKIKATIEAIRKDEKLSQITAILVGVGGASLDAMLKPFAAQAGFDQYVGLGDASAEKLARLAKFVSKSISSSSQALATGGQSQTIAF